MVGNKIEDGEWGRGYQTGSVAFYAPNFPGGHGGLRAGPKGAPEAEGRRGARSVTKQKKKQRDKDKARLLEAMGTSKNNEEEERRGLDKRTPARAAFEKRQGKRQMERILRKASRSHKQRGEDFSGHPDARTEHCGIPKVSWSRWQARPGYRVASRRSRRRRRGYVWGLGIFWKHSCAHLLASSAETVLFKAVCPHSGTWLKSDCPFPQKKKKIEDGVAS